MEHLSTAQSNKTRFSWAQLVGAQAESKESKRQLNALDVVQCNNGRNCIVAAVSGTDLILLNLSEDGLASKPMDLTTLVSHSSTLFTNDQPTSQGFFFRAFPSVVPQPGAKLSIEKTSFLFSKSRVPTQAIWVPKV